MERDDICYKTPSKAAVVRNFPRKPKYLEGFALHIAPEV